MAGTDTSRGMNFQYACALGFLIDVIQYTDWATVQFEGDQDIEDVVIYNAAGIVVLRAQIKQKTDPYQWEPHELRDILVGFSKTPDSEKTSYQFLYSGSEGKTFAQRIRPILIKVESEGWDALGADEILLLKGSFGDVATDFFSKIGSRFKLAKKESWKSIETQDLRKLRELLTKAKPSTIEDDAEETIYNSLFHEIARKTEEVSKYYRRLTRAEILHLVGISETALTNTGLQIQSYISWLREETRQKLFPISLSIQREDPTPNILTLLTNVKSESLVSSTNTNETIFEVIKNQETMVLVGEPGSGKTFTLWQLAISQCEELERKIGHFDKENLRIPVIIDLCGYDGTSIDEIIQSCFQASGQFLTRDAIKDLTEKGELLVLLDDFDMARSQAKSELLLRLKKWCKVNNKCKVVITTHSPQDGHNLGMPTYRLLPLTWDQAKNILVMIPGVNSKDALAILVSLSEESLHLQRSPMMLHMIAYVYLSFDHRVPRSRSPLYDDVIKGILSISEQKGFCEFDRSDKVQLLSLLARWMQNNETYVISPTTLGSLLQDWVSPQTHLAHLGSGDISRLRLEIGQSGLFQRRSDGNIEYCHPTFRAFLAATTITKDEFPELLKKETWRNSIILWASIQDVFSIDHLIESLVDDTVLLGQIIRERSEKREITERDEPTTISYFECLNYCICLLLRRYPILTKDLPWSSLSKNKLGLCVAKSAEKGYILFWQSLDKAISSVKFTSCTKLIEEARRATWGVPFHIFILPEDVVQKYYPLEVAYFWLIKSLYDLVTFVAWEGGLNPISFEKSGGSHPAIALITNRFLLYHEVADNLPFEIVEQLPFYAAKAFKLAIEVDENSQFPVVLYSIIPSLSPERAEIIQSVQSRAIQDPKLFRRDNGICYLKIGDTEEVVPSIEEVSLGQVMTESPSVPAQQWLIKDIKAIIPGFPPEPW